MPKVTVAITSTASHTPVDGDNFDHYQYQLLTYANGELVQTVNSTESTVTFPENVPVGEYTLSIVPISTCGLPMSGGLTTTYTVTAPVYVAFASPSAVSVSQN